MKKTFLPLVAASALLFTACSGDKKTDKVTAATADTTVKITDSTKLVLLFSTYVTDNGEKYNSKIAISDSVFLHQGYTMGHTSGYWGDPYAELWINAVKINGQYNFDSLVKKYKLKILKLKTFVNYDNDILTAEETDRLKISFDTSIEKGISMTIKRLKNGDIIQFTDSVTSDKNTLRLFSGKKLSTFSIARQPFPMGWLFLKLYNITGDEKEEIFIFTPDASYWGMEWYVQVYELR